MISLSLNARLLCLIKLIYRCLQLTLDLILQADNTDYGRLAMGW